MKISLFRTILLLVMFGVTTFFLQDVAGVHRTPIIQSLAHFPVEFDGGWQTLSSRKASEEVIQLLGVDDYIEYNYSKSDTRVVNFYAAFYEAVGKGAGYHSPKNCIPGGGWGIEKIGTVSITPKGRNKIVTISEMLIRNGNDYQVVYYWYHNRGRIIYSEYWEKVHLVLDSILKKRRDGTFVRLMTPVADGNIDKARKRLSEFAEIVMPELDNFIPGSRL